MCGAAVASDQAWLNGPAVAYGWLADRARAHQIGPAIYDDANVSDAIAAETHGRVRDIVSPTPPSAALLMLPLSFFGPRTRVALWANFNVFALTAAVLLLAVTLDWSRWLGAIALIGLVLFVWSPPLAENLERGQVYVWLLLASTIALVGYMTERHSLIAAGLASALLLKAFGLPLWALFAWNGRRRVLAVAAAIVAGVILIGLPWVGFATYVRWAFSVVPSWLHAPHQAVSAYQTIGGFFAHLGRFDAHWNPVPLVDAPRLALALTIASSAGLFGWLLTRPLSPSSFAAALQLSILAQPVAEQYHYVLAVIPLAVAVAESARHRQLVAAGLTPIAAWLLWAPLTFKCKELWIEPCASQFAGVRGLLAYPRLYGGVLVFIALMLVSRKDVAL